MLHIYYGKGKGKTSAAVGSVMRANGAGIKTAFLQFMKNGFSSEIRVLQMLKNNNVICCKECDEFTYNMDEQKKQLVKQSHDEMMKQIYRLSETDDLGLVVLDEMLDAYNEALIDKKLAEDYIMSFKDKVEIIITGRKPLDIFVEAADYMTEMKCQKHPYNKGISARKGIEY